MSRRLKLRFAGVLRGIGLLMLAAVVMLFIIYIGVVRPLRQPEFYQRVFLDGNREYLASMAFEAVFPVKELPLRTHRASVKQFFVAEVYPMIIRTVADDWTAYLNGSKTTFDPVLPLESLKHRLQKFLTIYLPASDDRQALQQLIDRSLNGRLSLLTVFPLPEYIQGQLAAAASRFRNIAAYSFWYCAFPLMFFAVILIPAGQRFRRFLQCCTAGSIAAAVLLLATLLFEKQTGRLAVNLLAYSGMNFDAVQQVMIAGIGVMMRALQNVSAAVLLVLVLPVAAGVFISEEEPGAFSGQRGALR